MNGRGVTLGLENVMRGIPPLCVLVVAFVGYFHLPAVAKLTPLIERSGPPVVVEKVVPTAFTSFPTDMAEFPDGSRRLLVTTLNGHVYSVDKFDGAGASLYLAPRIREPAFWQGISGRRRLPSIPGLPIPKAAVTAASTRLTQNGSICRQLISRQRPPPRLMTTY